MQETSNLQTRLPGFRCRIVERVIFVTEEGRSSTESTFGTHWFSQFQDDLEVI